MNQPKIMNFIAKIVVHKCDEIESDFSNYLWTIIIYAISCRLIDKPLERARFTMRCRNFKKSSKHADLCHVS